MSGHAAVISAIWGSTIKKIAVLDHLCTMQDSSSKLTNAKKGWQSGSSGIGPT
jgi:hypothetical protein